MLFINEDVSVVSNAKAFALDKTEIAQDRKGTPVRSHRNIRYGVENPGFYHTTDFCAKRKEAVD